MILKLNQTKNSIYVVPTVFLMGDLNTNNIYFIGRKCGKKIYFVYFIDIKMSYLIYNEISYLHILKKI